MAISFLSMFRNVISFKTSIRDIGRCKKLFGDLSRDINDDMTADEIRELIQEKMIEIDFITNELKKRAVASDSRFKDYLKKNSSQKQLNGITITDHAIVRYLERGMGVDLNALMQDMLDSAHITAERMGKRTTHTAIWFHAVEKKVKLIAYGKNIVTVIPDVKGD